MKADRERADIKNVLPRLDQWAADAGSEYIADNPGVELGGVARDLAMSAEYSFEKDEWISLLQHFDWDDDVVLGQISHLIGQYPDWRWTISTSRRTPEPLQDRLDDMAGVRITVVHPQQTHEDWLSHQLSASRAVWVTPDSMSMVC